MSAQLHIHLLGGFQLTYDGQPLTAITQARQQSLLAYLLLHADAAQSRQHLAFLFWPDSSEKQARANLRYLLHQLRHNAPELEPYLRIDRQTVQWRADADCWLDVAAFDAALAQADAHLRPDAENRHSAAEALEAALDLYGGDLLPEGYDEWVLAERERLSQRYARALERLVGLLEEAGDYPRAIRYAQRLLRHDPLHEVAYRRLMALYARSGDRARALSVYHTCVTTLAQELGVEPAHATQEAYERILHQEAEPVTVSPSAAPLPTPAPTIRLIGRKPEWERLQAAWRRVARDGPHLALIAGEAGIGKTRLAEELLTWARRRGIVSARTRAYAAEGRLAYAPVTEWLRSEALGDFSSRLEAVWLTEVARLLPEVLAERPDLAPPQPMREGWQRGRLFESLARAILTANRPLLLQIDDLQWCDQETLEWLRYLLHFDPQAKLLLVGTVRPEEVDADHPVRALLLDLQRDGQITQIELGPLGAAETAALATEVGGRELAPALLDDVYVETQGVPLFVVETVRVRGETGSTRQKVQDIADGVRDAGQVSLPPKVYAVIQSRLAGLSPTARELVNLAAVVGRAFSFETLAAASQEGEDAVVRGLDELWRRRIVREQGAAAYDFGHDRIRDVAYAEISPVRRRALHRRVAEALERVHAADLDTVSGQLAVHYKQVGLSDKAILYYLQAGGTAQRIYANAEAIAHFKGALALLDAPSRAESRSEWRLEALTGLGRIHSLLGNSVLAEQYLREAIAIGKEIWLPVHELTRLYGKLGGALHHQGRFDERIRIGKEGLALLGDDAESLSGARMNQTIAMGYRHKGNPAKFREFTYRTARILKGHRHIYQHSSAIYHIVQVCLSEKKVTEAQHWIQELESQARQHDHLPALNEAQVLTSQLALWTGQTKAAITTLSQTLAGARTMGYSGRIVVVLITLAEAYFSLGILETAAEYVDRGLKRAQALQHTRLTATGYDTLGCILLAQGEREQAAELFRKALQSFRRGDWSADEMLAREHLVRTNLALGDRRQAMEQVRDVVAQKFYRSPHYHWMSYWEARLVNLLSVLEATYADADVYHAFCLHFQEVNPGIEDAPVDNWYLTPAEAARTGGTPRAREEFPGSLVSDWALSSGWARHDPLGDCSFKLQKGLELRAANGRDLWHINLSAPRLLRPAPGGDFALETLCGPASTDAPAIGGLLLWQEQENYLRLDRGTRGPHEISFQGCIGNRDVIVGRGQLEMEKPNDQVRLRLERVGDRVQGLCSADGEGWFSVGSVEFPVAGPLQVGLHAIGHIDRTVYHGAYPEGTAIRFESFRVWGQ